MSTGFEPTITEEFLNVIAARFLITLRQGLEPHGHRTFPGGTKTTQPRNELQHGTGTKHVCNNASS